MHFVMAELERKQRYKLIAGAIVPRPIALVTTLNADGSCNAAPFSAFNYMSEDPPLVALGLEVKPDTSPRAGAPKDTTVNIARTGEFVVNTIDEDLLPEMVDCAVDFEPGVSEVAVLGLATVPGVQVAVPRLARAPFALECRRVVALDFGPFRTIVIGEILGIHARDGLVDPVRLRIDLDAYRPVGRLTGAEYLLPRERASYPTRTVAEFRRDGPARRPNPMRE